MTLYTIAITLILIIDPLGNIPIFLSLLRAVPENRRRLVIIRESIIALVILTVFLFYGQYIIEAMHISEEALTMSGGIILFIIALRMIFPTTKEVEPVTDDISAEPLIVPLAVPMFAGPSALVMVMLMARQATYPLSQLFIAVFIAWLVSALILIGSDVFQRILGDRCLIAIERLMGMILTTLAVQMFLNGLVQVLHTSG